MEETQIEENVFSSHLIFFYIYHAEVHTARYVRHKMERTVLFLKELRDLDEKHSLRIQQKDATAITKTKGEAEEEEEEEKGRICGGGEGRDSRCYRGQVLNTW